MTKLSASSTDAIQAMHPEWNWASPSSEPGMQGGNGELKQQESGTQE